MRRLATAVAVLALAACGDPPTHDEFVAKATNVCDEHVARLLRIAREGTSRSPLTERERRIWTDAYFDAYGDMVDALTDLDRPRDDPAVERYLARLDEIADDLEDGAADAYERRSPTTRSLAKDAGLEACQALR